MAAPRPIRPTALPTGTIRATELASRRMRFSFRYFQGDHPAFSIRNRDGSYLAKLLERLKALSAMTAEEVRTNKSKALRAHTILWMETSQPRGFAQLHEQLQAEQPWQFEVSANEHGRVHGFFIDEIFFVVWLDPNHNLYP